ncbi:hypothetical protein KY285_026854 [Solanum tuberosum]|nr:hypothetical protein KY289_027054 [Solanum tuberosum]KAH0661940.1 hypothetical protein KY284_026871 [Solanum tuberosum]KAH0665648.1 hypothetical protein KY285_026854 [Solanum tuberosum]
MSQVVSNQTSYTPRTWALFHVGISVQLVGSQLGRIPFNLSSGFVSFGGDMFADNQVIFHGMGDDLVADGDLLVIKGIIVSCEPNVPEAKEDEGVPVHPLIEIIVPQCVPLVYPVIFINIVSDCSPLIVAL